MIIHGIMAKCQKSVCESHQLSNLMAYADAYAIHSLRWELSFTLKQIGSFIVDFSW